MNLPEDDLSLLLRALRFAADKHRHQRRKDDNASPYINHPIAVAQTLTEVAGVTDAVTLAAAILHDTIEDTDTSPEELEAGFGEQIRSIVEEVTDDKSLPAEVRKRHQIETAGIASHQARLIRLADKICNLEDLSNAPPTKWSQKRKEAYVVWASEVADQLSGTNPALEDRFREISARARQSLNGL